MRKYVYASLLATIGLSLSGCFSLHNVDMNELSKKVPTTGSPLPFHVLKSDLKDAQGKTFEIRNGGFGSDAVKHPTIVNQFYALADRGPNATFVGKYGKGKMFPVPDYTPRIGLFELQNDGSVKLIQEILLKRPNGTLITGLPNSSAYGGTGETPYDINGNVIRKDMSKPYDKKSNPIKLDDYGLDGEGLVALKDGTFWVSDEYGPHIVHFDKDGIEIERINAFKTDTRGTIKLPQEFANRRPNRGMEGLTITPDEKTLVGIMQSTMYNPSKKVKKSNITRIVAINPKTGETAQYLYKQEKAQNANSAISAISKTKFYVIERDGGFLLGGPKKANPKAQKDIFEIDLSTGTNLESLQTSGHLKQDDKLGLLIDGKTLEQIVVEEGWAGLAKYGIKPVQKRLVLDVAKELKYPHDKMEGLWIINKDLIGILNDDDFGVWATKNSLHSKVLGNGKLDVNTLYIVKIKK